MVARISSRVSTPTIVVNRPSFLDFVQPDNEIMTVNEKSPIRKVSMPINLGTAKSVAVTSLTYPPGVVIIEIWIMAKTVTRKQPEDSVAHFKIRSVSSVVLSETNKLATMVIENPLNKELIRMVCLASSFQYDGVISILICLF